MMENTSLIVEPNTASAIVRAMENKNATYEELDRAANLLTMAMGRLMDLRTSILNRMRATGRLK